MRARTGCADLVAQGSIRINRQPTGKPHAKLRVGDVLTIPVHAKVRVLRVASLAIRRGPATEAQLLYVDISPPEVDTKQPDLGPGQQEADSDEVNSGDANDVSATPCIAADSSAYRAP